MYLALRGSLPVESFGRFLGTAIVGLPVRGVVVARCCVGSRWAADFGNVLA